MNINLKHRLDLRAGEWVEVRTQDEILATLDGNGRLEEMPFMPEMLRYCGKKMRVGKRAHKTCDPAMGIVGRRLEGAVHLENIRCDGSAHDGCQAACLIFWKEAWLKRIEKAVDPSRKAPINTSGHDDQGHVSVAALQSVVKTVPAPGETEPTYMCQNTQVKFASTAMKWWDARQYVEDFTSGNVTMPSLVTGFLYTFWRTVAEAGIGLGAPMRWIYDTVQRAIGGSPYPLRPFGVPDGVATPKLTLDLKEGELVRVKSQAAIMATLDSRYRNRGLYFDPDYIPFTEREYKVARRVKQIIDERDGKMIRFKSDAIILEDVVCEGRYAVCRRFCPRAIVPYWREIWLERVSDDPAKKV